MKKSTKKKTEKTTTTNKHNKIKTKNNLASYKIIQQNLYLKK